MGGPGRQAGRARRADHRPRPIPYGGTARAALSHSRAQRLWSWAGRKGLPPAWWLLRPLSPGPYSCCQGPKGPGPLWYVPASACVLTVGPGGLRTDTSQRPARMGARCACHGREETGGAGFQGPPPRKEVLGCRLTTCRSAPPGDRLHQDGERAEHSRKAGAASPDARAAGGPPEGETGPPGAWGPGAGGQEVPSARPGPPALLTAVSRRPRSTPWSRASRACW